MTAAHSQLAEENLCRMGNENLDKLQSAAEHCKRSLKEKVEEQQNKLLALRFSNFRALHEGGDVAEDGEAQAEEWA